ncbi:MAG TPA: hypothetical protein VLK29_08670 [Luteimonas sp.]|nr:hypothetical protein [Luteimonas sp.]
MPDLQPVFAALSSILRPHADRLHAARDTSTELYVETRHMLKTRKPLFFGAAQIGKTAVSFHLMPVYLHPGLLDPISPALRRHMQGKSCFHFRTIDPGLFVELAGLVEAGYASYRDQGFVQ